MINESMLAYQYEENDIEKYKNIILYEQKKDVKRSLTAGL